MEIENMKGGEGTREIESVKWKLVLARRGRRHLRVAAQDVRHQQSWRGQRRAFGIIIAGPTIETAFVIRLGGGS